MDFLNQIIFSNPVKSYLAVAGTILLALLLKRYLSRYIASILYRLVTRIWTTVSKQTFTDLVIQPLEWFLVILISIFATDKLIFPEALVYTLYGHTTDDILSRFGTGIIIVLFIWLVLRVMDFIALVLEQKANLTDDTRDNQLIVYFRDFLKVIIGICGVLLIIKACFKQPLGNLLTGLSIVGAALALGAKESLENLIASFIIFFDKPFFAGDTVKVNNLVGRVERIGLRSTRIRTGDQTLVTVPNKQMVDTMIDNLSMQTARRAEIRLELSVKTSFELTEKLIASFKELLGKNNESITAYSVYLKELNKNGLTIIIEYFTQPFSLAEFDGLKQHINLEIKKQLEANTVVFAGQENRVIVTNDNSEKNNG